MRRVGDADEKRSVPGQGKGRPVPAERNREAGLPAVRLREDGVHAFAQAHDRCAVRIREPPDAVEPGPRRVHPDAEAKREQAVAAAVLEHAGDEPISNPLEGREAKVIADDGAAFRRGPDSRDGETPIVRLRLLQERAATQAVECEGWDEALRFRWAEQLAS